MSKVNKAIRILITSDFFLNCGWGLLAPIFAIFIIQNITTGNSVEAAKVAGFGALFYWVTKSILQIPIGNYLDKNHGEIDDFWFMVAGMFLASLVPFGFLFSSLPWHIYLLQVVHAIAMAIVIPPWMAIFTRHIDEGKEALEWGMESTGIGLGAGFAGAAGGTLVALFGFQIVFILTGGFTFLSAILLLLIRKEISPVTKHVSHLPYSPSPF